MNITYPITFDDPVEIAGNSTNELTQRHLGTDAIFTEDGVRAWRNGYDSSSENGNRGLRVTNISGLQGGDLLKWCPDCNQHLPQQDFDPTRTTNERRDQSYCKPCRAKYAKST